MEKKIIASKPIRRSHLSVVLAETYPEPGYNGSFEYVTWIFNERDGGYCGGRYFGQDIVAASRDFENR